MRLKIECQDRMGIAMDILAVVVKHRVNIADVEIGGKRFYVYLPGAAKHTIQALTQDILTIVGVVKVDKVDFMPKEREHFEFNVLLNAFSFPVLSIDMKGMILYANPAAEQIFKHENLRQENIKSLLRHANVKDALKNLRGNRYGLSIDHDGIDYSLDMFPVEVEEWNEKTVIGAVLCFQAQQPLLSTSDNGVSEPKEDASLYYNSERMGKLYAQLRSFARIEGNLLIFGEAGVGKAQAAQYCHRVFAGSEAGFIPIVCSGLNENELKSQLQQKLLCSSEADKMHVTDSHEAMDKAATSKRSVFFANIDALPRASQLWLIKMISHKADTGYLNAEDAQIAAALHSSRLIASSRQTPIEFAQVAANCYELFTLFGKYSLHLPALRERGAQELEFLAKKYLETMSETQSPKRLTPNALIAMSAHPWPGNLTELKQRLQQALTLSHSDDINADLIFPGKSDADLMGFNNLTIDESQSLDEMVKDFEARILKSLHPQYPSSRKLARRLGLSHTAIANKLREYGIP